MSVCIAGWASPAGDLPSGAPSGRRRAQSPDRSRGRVLVAALDLDAADGPLTGPPEPAEVLALVRLHRHPLGTVRLSIPADRDLPTTLRRAAVMQLGGAIAEHERRDRALDGPLWQRRDPPPGGQPPPCLKRRAAALADPTPISVVVRARGHADGGLERCLDSVAALDYPSYEVLVVGHGPDARAARQIAARARGRIIAVTDDASVVDRDWLAAIAEAFTDTRFAVAVGSVMPTLRRRERPASVWPRPLGNAANLAFDAQAFATLYQSGPMLTGRHRVARRREIHLPDAVVWHQVRDVTEQSEASRTDGRGPGSPSGPRARSGFTEV